MRDSSSDNEKPSSLMDRDHAEKLETIELTKLFEPKQGQKPSRVLMTGRAGIGKSTLCQKIAHDWASGRLWNEQFEVIYWIPLRALNQKKLLFQNGKPCMESLLSRLLLNQQVEESDLITYVEKTKGKSLWLLDGYDEASPELQHVVQVLLKEKEMSFLITSRPEATSTLSSSMNLHIENVGFSKEHIKTYVKQFFSQKLIKTPVTSFLNQLRQHNHLFEIASIPLHLQMLCSLWEKNQKGFNSSLTGLYQQMIQQMLKWGQRKFDISQSEPLLLMLGKIAEQGLTLSHLLLSKEILKKALTGTSLYMEDLLATGLVKESDGGYTFIHLSFQEYLAAYRIAGLSSEEIKSYIVKHRDLNSHQLVLPFLCGILYQRNPESSIFFFNAFFSQRQENPHLGLALECLNECPGSVSIPSLDDALINSPRFLSELFLWEDRSLCYQSQTIKYLYHQGWYQEEYKVEKETTISCFLGIFKAGNFELVRWLYEKEPTLFNKINECITTPIHFLARKGKLEIAQWLYEKDPLVLKKTDEDGTTPLHWAARKGELEMAQWLYEKDPGLLNKTDEHGDTPLHWAARKGELEMAQWLYEKDPLLINKTDLYNVTPLHLAAREGELEMARWLYEKDPLLLNKINKASETPFYLAVKNDNLEMAQWFYEKDPGLLNKTPETVDGWTPVHIAANLDKLEMIQWLYEKDPLLLNTTNKYGNTPLHWPAHFGTLKMIQWLYEKDPLLINKTNKNGETPFHSAACQDKQLKIAQWLYEKDPLLLNKTTNDGETPLHLAAWWSRLETAQWLYEKDPLLLHKTTNNGKTPLHSAAEGLIAKDKLEIVQWLYEKDPLLLNTTTNNGETPFHFAAKRGKLEIAQWLYEKDPLLLHKTTNTGQTPLHFAAYGGDLWTVMWISGLAPEQCSVKDNSGQTPIQTAQKNGKLDVVSWLQANHKNDKCLVS